MNTDEQLVEPSPADQLTSAIYGSWPFTLPITWGAVAGTLIWRGKVRSAWSRQGYDYDTFRLVAKMRGSPTRIRLLNAMSASPKNKLQLAKELEVDWKTIDNHIDMLLQGRLVEERTVVGTSRYYGITTSGQKVLSLLSSSKMDGDKVGN
jgi:DNA-binding transcriptional ArsR family regulator